MKKTILFSLVLIAAIPMMAQNEMHERKQHKHVEITELVDDLSPVQKRKVESIDKSSRERIETLRARKRVVGDSIAMLMDRDGDQSRALFPLFDREASIQVEISRQMYQTKCRIDEVLTPDQRTRLREACRKEDSRPRMQLKPTPKASKPEIQQRFIKK